MFRYVHIGFILSVFFFLSGFSLQTAVVEEKDDVFFIQVSVADLRREPKEIDGKAALKRPYDLDRYQETQLIYGEKVKVLEERGGWVRVEALEQQEYSHNNIWEGYPGWVKKEALVSLEKPYVSNAAVRVLFAKLHDAPEKKSPYLEVPMGARLRVTFQKSGWWRVERPGGPDGWIRARDVMHLEDIPSKTSDLRRGILKAAKLFLGEPYYWGGRASHRPHVSEQPTGVDCSGLVNLVYRVYGIDVPRDSHEQYMTSRPLSSYKQLERGDLIFLAKEDTPDKIFHVMMYAGGQKVIEAVHEFDTVRYVSLREKLGAPLQALAPMEPVDGLMVYFGRLLPEKIKGGTIH